MLQHPPLALPNDERLRRLRARSWPANDRDEALFSGVLRGLVAAQRDRARLRRTLGALLALAALSFVYGLLLR